MDPKPDISSSRQPRRWRRPILYTLLILAAITGGVLATRLVLAELAEQEARHAESALQEAIAEVDHLEPAGWRLNDLEKQRASVPDRENASNLIIEAAQLLPEDWNDDAILESVQNLPPPCRLTAEKGDELSAALDKLRPALKPARRLARYARGRFPPLGLGPDQFTYENPYTEHVRDLAHILYCDALGHAARGNTRRAWQSAVAALSAGRAIGDEPAIRSQFIRLEARKSAVMAIERVLGRGAIAIPDLAQARNRLTEELRLNLLLPAIRGERAAQHDFYSRIARGQPPLDTVIRPAGGHLRGFSPADIDEEIRRAIIAAEPTKRRVIIAESHAYTLRALTRAVACAKRPEADRDQCLREWDFVIKDDKARRHIGLLAALLTPAIYKVHIAQQRSTLLLRCAVTALAAEQRRLQVHRWPRDLAELVGLGLLPDVPLDSDGQPLRLRHTADGLVVYSVGPSGTYAGTRWDHLTAPSLDFPEPVEFRLWNPDRRGRERWPPADPDDRCEWHTCRCAEAEKGSGVGSLCSFLGLIEPDMAPVQPDMAPDPFFSPRTNRLHPLAERQAATTAKKLIYSVPVRGALS